MSLKCAHDLPRIIDLVNGLYKIKTLKKKKNKKKKKKKLWSSELRYHHSCGGSWCRCVYDIKTGWEK